MGKITVEQIQNIVGDKYKVVSYVGSQSPVILLCQKHGTFKLRLDHIRDAKTDTLCPVCKSEMARLEKFEEFKRRAIEIHGDKYTYHLDTFTNLSSKTLITCPIHGDFWQVPENHIWAKQGCRKCADESKNGKYKYTTDEVIEMCKKTHGDKYVYDEVVFQGMKKKLLNIKCPKHGYFDQNAYDHIRGFGCEKCKFENQIMPKEEFIQRALKIHNGKYLYDAEKINYLNNNVKIPIICPEHGEFWQRPANHLLGVGCPHCSESKLERDIVSALNAASIVYERKCHFDWLGRLELDFFLPDYNVGIECQGKQHFQPVEFFNGGDTFETVKERDMRKLKLCNANGIKLFYYSNLGIEYPYLVFEDPVHLLNEIMGVTK